MRFARLAESLANFIKYIIYVFYFGNIIYVFSNTLF